jgi:molecular chaperone GrpE
MSENLFNQANSSASNDQNNLAQENQSNNNENQVLALQNQIKELNQKLIEANDKNLRSLAELDNFRKRSREELEKSNKFAIANFVSDLVMVAENFFMASENSPKEEIAKNPAVQNYATAIEMTEKELLKVLEKNKVQRIFPMNQEFDHNFHEAIAHIDSDAKEGTIVQVIQAGYSIADRLIRPALVGVAKPKS